MNAATDTVDQLHQMISTVAGACDGAHKHDSVGFSQSDVPLGHFLSNTPAEAWTPDMVSGAIDLAHHYRRQIEDAGFDLAELPAKSEDAGLRERLADARHAADEARRAAERVASSFCTTATVRGDSCVVLSFPYDPTLVAEARYLPGRTYKESFAGHEKVNVYPASSAGEVAAWAESHGIRVDDTVRALATQPAPAPAPNLMYSSDRSRVVFHTDRPNRAAAAEIKELPGRSWDSATASWTIPTVSLADVVSIARRHGLTVAGDVAADADTAAADLERNLTMATALTPAGPGYDVPGLAGELKPHQHAALEFILANRRVIVGDVMGLGKTLESLAAVAVDNAWPVVVACKSSLKLNWAAEVARFLPDRRVFIAEGLVPEPVPTDTDVIIVGLDVLRTKYKPCGDTPKPGWAVALAALAPAALICDESQLGKEASAARSKGMEAIGKAVAARGGLVMALSGTAILNRPKELLQQLEIISRVGDLGGVGRFLNRYCDPHYNGWGTTFDGASHLQELHHLLKARGIYLRRGQDAVDLPALTIRPVWIEETDVPEEAMDAYQRAEQNFIREILRKAQSLTIDLTDPVQRADYVRRVLEAGSLVKLGLLRERIGAAKQQPVVKAVAALIADGEKVMVAAHHREQVDAYADAFGGLRIQGGQKVDSVEADKAAFQTRPVAEAPVIAVSITAGGVGHTLTAAARGVIAELPWTWADIAQMSCRLHRIGQTRDVEVVVPLVRGTVDEHMWQVIGKKKSIGDRLLDGAVAEADGEQSVAAEVTGRLIVAAMAAGGYTAGAAARRQAR